VTGRVVLALPFLAAGAGCLPCEQTGDPDALTVSRLQPGGDAAGGDGALHGYLVLDEVATPLRFRADLQAARAPDELRVAVRRGDAVLVDVTTEPDYFDQERCGPRAANVPVYFGDGLD
jgi:hypothetical protein